PEAEDLLEDKKWVLVEIENDSTSQIDSMEQRPFLEFDTQKKRISGFAGCNRFFGQYSVEKDSTTQFSEMGATKKYCMDTMETEDLFLDVLRKCRYLKINKTMLIMEDRNHEKMAVFSNNRSLEY
ncbi:MAG: META domain-containing protein, partial [Bacteroidota bacterium]